MNEELKIKEIPVKTPSDVAPHELTSLVLELLKYLGLEATKMESYGSKSPAPYFVNFRIDEDEGKLQEMIQKVRARIPTKAGEEEITAEIDIFNLGDLD